MLELCGPVCGEGEREEGDASPGVGGAAVRAAGLVATGMVRRFGRRQRDARNSVGGRNYDTRTAATPRADRSPPDFQSVRLLRAAVLHITKPAARERNLHWRKFGPDARPFVARVGGIHMCRLAYRPL